MIHPRIKMTDKETCKLQIFYDDPQFTTTHEGVSSEMLQKVMKSFEKRKIFWFYGTKKLVGVDFSKVVSIFYEVTKIDPTT